MSDMPEKNTETDQELLARWYEMNERLGKLRFQESMLRKQVVARFFPEDKENPGTHKYNLPGDYILRAEMSLEYKIDNAALTNVKGQLKDHKINVDKLVRWKPELEVKHYKTLNDDQKALVSSFITAKLGSPKVTIKAGGTTEEAAPAEQPEA
jgi:hypothetical protein